MRVGLVSRHFLKRSGILLALAAGVLLLVLWIAAGRLASPARRELQGYHREF